MPHRVEAGLWVGAVLVLVVVYFVFDPATSGLFPRCPTHWLTGLHCPGCGAQRAIHALLHGQLLTALHMNALAVGALPALAYAYVSRLCELLGLARLPRVTLSALSTRLLAYAIVAFAVLRNIDVWPLTWLAPL